jgi:hypothetical protein
MVATGILVCVVKEDLQDYKVTLVPRALTVAPAPQVILVLRVKLEYKVILADQVILEKEA